MLVIIAGYLERVTGKIPFAWSIVFFIVAGLFIAPFVYHQFILPKPASDKGTSNNTVEGIIRDFADTFVSFFTKKGIGLAIALCCCID